jgi:hypothetical protein
MGLRRGIWITVVATSCALVVATSAYVGFTPIRIKLTTEPVEASADGVRVVVTNPLADELSAPWAVVARIRHASTVPGPFAIFVDGQQICERQVSPGRLTRIDCSAGRGWAQGRGPHELLMRGADKWTLEHLEIATHHGNTTGPLVSYVLPAGSSAFVRPSRLWVLVVFAAVVALFVRRPTSGPPPVVRLVGRVIGAIGVLLLAAVIAAPAVSGYRVVVSAGTLAEWIGVIALLHRWPVRWLPRVRVTAQRAAGLAAAGIFIVGLALGTRALGGSDSYGYVSEADLWLAGDLKIPQAFAVEAPWPDADRAFAPLGYRPSPADNRVIVPTYSPGLPMLFALAKLVGGQTAIYVVVPLFASALVLATFGLGRRLGSDAVGLIGACLVATSPIVVAHTLVAMTDVPVAAAFTAAFYLALGPLRTRNAVAAGLMAGVAVLIRPNLVPLAGILGLHYAMQVWTPPERRRAITLCVCYGLSVLPAIVTVALVNRWLYGSPLTSGYGALDQLFAWNRIGTNLWNYATWLIESQTPAALIGAAAIVVPLRSVWPRVQDRRVFFVMGVFVVALWAIYCAWDVFDSWPFLRFLIASLPFFMLGLGAVAVAGMRLSSRWIRAAAVCVVVVIALMQVRYAGQQHVLNWGWGEDRNVAIARFVRRLTPPNSVIVSLHHSGSIRYYGGRMTIYFPWLAEQALDEAVDWLAARGVHTYALIEDWEMAEFRARYVSQQRARAVEERPLAVYREPGYARLFDLTGPRETSKPAVTASGAPRLWFAPSPVPLEPLRFEAPEK